MSRTKAWILHLLSGQPETMPAKSIVLDACLHDGASLGAHVYSYACVEYEHVNVYADANVYDRVCICMLPVRVHVYGNVYVDAYALICV